MDGDSTTRDRVAAADDGRRARFSAVPDWLVPALAVALAYYLADVFWPRTAQAAFPYVIAPPVSWLFIAVVLGSAALVSRR